MPTYDYVCTACGHEMEEFQSMKDEPLRKCPACGKNKLQRQIGLGSGIIFKGSGFYETDYKRKEQPSASKDSGSDSSSSSESKSSESNPSSEKKSGGSKKDKKAKSAA